MRDTASPPLQDLASLLKQSLRLTEEAPTAPERHGHRQISKSLLIALVQYVGISSNGATPLELDKTLSNLVLGDKP